MKILLRYYTLLLAILLSFSGCVTEDEPVRSLQPGDKIPDFSLESNGEILSTAQMTATRNVIVFFNTGCDDCRKALNDIQRAYEEDMLVNTPTSYYCISREENYEDVKKYWDENNLTLPFFAQSDRRIYNLFASTGIPRIYVFDKNHIILRTYE